MKGSLYSFYIRLTKTCLNLIAKPTIDFNTVKPVYSGHLGDQFKVATIGRWPL